MIWNWQQKSWPEFIYDAKAFSGFENQFLQKAGFIQGCLEHIDAQDKESLTINLMSEEAFKTSEIEGEILNRDSLLSSIKKQFGLKTDNRKIPAAEQGISEMMVDLYHHYDLALEHKHLFHWHEMLMNGRRDLANIGSYRTHGDAMQIVSGSIHEPKIHFEAPASKVVNQEMSAFITWFNQTGPTGEKVLPMLTRSGIAHLYFESIHPFEDGNGRIGRAISEKALSQNLGRPTLIAIAHTIEKQKKAYYAALQSGSRELDISEWLDYFCQMVLSAQDYTQSCIDFLIAKAKFYKHHADTFNLRQTKVIERVFREGVEGFKGGLSAENYIQITGASRATATRDLQSLVKQGALTKIGERKYTRYFLNLVNAT